MNKQHADFDRFAALTKRIVNVPKSDVDKLAKAEKEKKQDERKTA